MEPTVLVVSAFITGLLGPVAVIVVKYYLEKKKSKVDMIADTLQVSEKITHKLDNIKEEVVADRVWLAQFHNGGHFYPTGKSIAKFSIVYETVSANVPSIQGNFQNIPVSLFSKSINELLENDIIEISDYRDQTIATFGLRYVADVSNSKSSYLFAIKTLDSKFIGVVGVDFVKSKKKLDTETVNHLANQATAVGGVLNTHLEKK